MTAEGKNCANINAIADTTKLEISFWKHGNRKKEKFNPKISVKYLILSNIDRLQFGYNSRRNSNHFEALLF